jgi:hypothetical protein
LRQLAEKQAEIAALPVHREKSAEWARLNSNEPGRSLVWINEIPWHEMDVDGELELRSDQPFCRRVERQLRRTIYQWTHMPADMIVESTFYSPLVIHDTGFGIQEQAEVVAQDPRGGILSRDFHAQIQDEGDLQKIRTPAVSHDVVASDERYRTLVELFGDILNIEQQGIIHYWFAPWDELIRWWDVENALLDLVLRPDLVHHAMERLLGAYLTRLEQWRELNLLSPSAGNYRVGSGGLGYTNELPRADSAPGCVRTADQWGCATAQIFSAVSPDMHEEFALQYERRWLEQFGLNYYGCCEPLDNKVQILRSIPHLRKISMSPWADVERMVAETNGDYVLSYKPNPAVLAADHWNPDRARKELVDDLAKVRGCALEIIMKDISTVRDEPQRLWEWSHMAMDVALSF